MAMWFRLLGVSLLLQEAQSQNRLDCHDVTRSENITVVMSNVVQENVCERLSEPLDIDRMAEHCAAFCGEHAIPIMVGTDSVGFSLTDIDGVCVASDDDPIVTHNPVRMQECRDWDMAMNVIKERAADLIASARGMTFEQMVFRTSMLEIVAEVEATMQSDETAEEVSLARIDLKLEVVRRILRSKLDVLNGDGHLNRALREKLAALRQKSSALQTAIVENLPKFQQFVEHCDELLLATGPANEYLLDLCSVTSSECIESNRASHAACCCGVVPAIGHFGIPAAKLGSRRLTGDEDSDDARGVDVCGHAYEMSADVLDAAKNTLCSSDSGPNVIAEHQTDQHCHYSQYFACPQQAETDRRLFGASEGGGQGMDHAETAEERRLQDDKYLQCNPPSATTDTNAPNLKVAFWEHTESALCKDIEEDGEEMKTMRLAEICGNFCTPTAVPFLLGTTSFGFNHSELDSVCLDPLQSGTTYDQEVVRACHDKAHAFMTLQNETASFVSSLQILEASRLRFVAATEVAAEEFKRLIREQGAATLDNARGSQKLRELKKLMRTALGGVLSSNTGSTGIKTLLKNDADDVSHKADLLHKELTRVIPLLEQFMSECNVMMTGVGPSQEYLLDLCSQTSRECLGQPEASHVGCCCGYNPVVTLGTTGGGIQSINGLSAAMFTGTGRVGSDRRLQEDSCDGVSAAMDICAEANRLSQQRIDEHYMAIRDDLGAGALIEANEASLAARYPAMASRCSEWHCGSSAHGHAAPMEHPNLQTGGSYIWLFLVAIIMACACYFIKVEKCVSEAVQLKIPEIEMRGYP